MRALAAGTAKNGYRTERNSIHELPSLEFLSGGKNGRSPYLAPFTSELVGLAKGRVQVKVRGADA